MSKNTILFQSLTPVQFAAVVRSGWRCFSSTNTGETFFYPKLHCGYAQTIARMFNREHFHAGYVVQFYLPNVFLAQYDMQSIAYDKHLEYKIPIGDLPLLNKRILGRIEVVSAFISNYQAESQERLFCKEVSGDLVLSLDC